MATGPTPREVMEHLKAGGDIERRSVAGGTWRSSVECPQIVNRLWSRMPDEPLADHRLVPFT